MSNFIFNGHYSSPNSVLDILSTHPIVATSHKLQYFHSRLSASRRQVFTIISSSTSEQAPTYTPFYSLHQPEHTTRITLHDKHAHRESTRGGFLFPPFFCCSLPLHFGPPASTFQLSHLCSRPSRPHIRPAAALWDFRAHVNICSRSVRQP